VLGKELDEDECKKLATIMDARSLKVDDVLVKEGEPESTLFLLTSGKLAVSSTFDGQEMTLYTMQSGECAGTRAFVDGTSRKATLRAVENSVVYSLEPTKFETLLESEPKIVYKVMRALFRITHMNLTRMNMESQEMANYISKSGGRY